ncbi:hypothetical protein M1L60_40420 [Actinoplanes sp. TRM 88003]|uniref:Uncharacterized protein n=1 Tax=Paractinoplanes aksuensis TaxID=2939490 RepID=A0ABT1E138_9ACTN|nr:hypothetical protein [Actinoplanes aksuensis]MCO8276864.1 hypothetical protein [Actinoplanes aksuensis]
MPLEPAAGRGRRSPRGCPQARAARPSPGPEFLHYLRSPAIERWTT